MKALLLAFLLASLTASANAQSVQPIALTRTKLGVMTTLEFREMRGRYRLWQDVSFDLRKWYHFDLGEVEGWRTFRLDLRTPFWSAGACAFWDYHLTLVQEEAEPVWKDYTQ